MTDAFVPVGPANHNLLSVSHGDTSAAAAVRGDLVVANSSALWARFAVGAANRILKANGTDPAWGQLVNADVDAAAAIAYSKLALTASIVDADIAASGITTRSKLPAAIAYEDEANTFSSSQVFSNGITVNTSGVTSRITDANATAMVVAAYLDHQTSGTAGAGLGVGLEFDLEDDANNSLSAGDLAAVWMDATSGSEDADFVFRARVAGTLTETARITNNALRLGERSSDPTAVANKGFVYTKDASGVTQLYYRDDAGTVTQLTPATGDAAGRVLRYLAFAA